MKYRIPRRIKHNQFLYGLSFRNFFIMVIVVIIAIVIFHHLSGPPRLVVPLFLVLGVYLGLTQEIDGETYFQIGETMIRDVFYPRIHLWEEVNHAKYYQRLHQKK